MEKYQFGVPTGAEEEAIDDELVAYNLQKVPCRQREPFVKFCRCARNGEGELIGGVLACSILWNILSIESVWVDPAYRGQHIASKLLSEVEQEARKAGCYMAQLDTFDFQAKGFYVVKVDSRNGSGMKAINNVIQEACKEKIERDRRRGIKNRPIRAMVVGIPNVGKSTFINTFAGRACAKTGNKPGVTKGKQWIRLNKGVELLDTPGILWPKFEDQQVGIRLACVGSITEDSLNMEELALWLIDYLRENYKGILAERYQITEEGTSVEVLEAIARARGCLKKQEELDYAKASLILFDDFRSGKMGRITLEWAPL